MPSKVMLRYSCLVALGLSLASVGRPQKTGKATTTPAESNTTSSPLILQEIEPFPDASGQDDTPLSVAARQARLHQEDRQRHLALDTARLVELSTQLQAEVNRAGNKNVLSLENLRRTEEIEKLARKVRERLKS